MVSRDLAKMLEEFVMTIGVGDDLVMRMGIDSVEDLRSNMLHVLHTCRLPKVNFRWFFFQFLVFFELLLQPVLRFAVSNIFKRIRLRVFRRTVQRSRIDLEIGSHPYAGVFDQR